MEKEKILFAETGSLTALASFPRSGNTWVRFLLEKTTGQLCGSVYTDRIMPRGQSGVAIKTHNLDSEKYARAIHLVRNPFDAIESYYHWRRDIGGEMDLRWDEHVQTSVEKWRAHTEHWLNSRCPTCRVRYEDLHADPVTEMERILSWMGYSHIPADAVRAAVEAASLENMRRLSAQYGKSFFRRGQVGKSYDHYRPEQRQFLTDHLSDHLQLLGYSDVVSNWPPSNSGGPRSGA